MTQSPNSSTRRYIAVSAGILVLAASGGIMASARSPIPSARPASTTTAPSTQPAPVMATPRSKLHSTDARTYLYSLADQIRTVPADAHPGPYAYQHTERWSRDSARLRGFVRRQWRNADGAGRVTEKTLPGSDNLARPSEDDRARLAAAKFEQVDHRAGSLPAVVAEPIATDPDALATQLARHIPPQAGPARLMTGIADMADVHYLGQEQRAAVLRLLASIEGIGVVGAADDLARAGVAVTVTAAGSTSRLFFDPATGVLFAFDEVLHVGRRGVFDIRLYLSVDRRAGAGA
ncbi:hypothetical protein [Plantactinospora sp. CA-290183]|uniref:hypothetical protein n=1 Tax=Plantactinospora sp. CA-290183 TaxID=3240006 RepID=UPI003D8CD546